MSKNTNINISLNINDLYDQTLNPIVQRISKSIISVWDLTFGRIDHVNEKYQIKRSAELDNFKLNLEEDINSIPPQKLIEPKLSIIGPTLENSKFYYEEEELRKMFAQLIASSMNSDKANKVRVAFSSIIREMSPLDANNLRKFKNSYSLPIALNQIVLSRNGNTQNFFQYIFFGDPRYPALCDEISSSINNLERLGLIKTTFDEYFSDESVYIDFKIPNKVIYPLTSEEFYNTSKGEFAIKKGIISLTNLGYDFIQVCF